MKKLINSYASPALLVLSALYVATQYARLGKLLDPASPYSEAGMFIAGLVVNLTVAYSASKVFRIKHQRSRRFAIAAFFLILILTPFLLTPVNLVTLDARIAGFWRWSVSVIAASIVDIAISVVALADPSLLASLPANTVAPVKPKSNRAVKKYTCECKAVYTDRFKFSGHQGKCEKHLIAAGKPIPVTAYRVDAHK